MLTSADYRSFKRNGFLVLEDALSESDVTKCRKLLWNALSFSPDTIGDAPSRYQLIDEEELDKVNPFEQIHNSVFQLADQLVGDNVLATPQPPFSIPDDMTLPMNLPDGANLANTHLRSNNHAHIDGFGERFKDPETDETYVYNTINAVVYFNDVVPGGGGFTVYPGSHYIASEYFETHSLPSPGWTGYLPAIDDSGGWKYNQQLGYQLRDLEVTGPAGTVVLYHNKLLHKAGFNQRNRVRMAGIMRFTHHLGDEIAEAAATDCWKYWPAMKDIEIDIEESPIMTRCLN
jgi:hypothetical protein